MERLADEWQSWVAENLLGGAAATHLVGALVAEGVDAALAEREVRAIEASPLIAGARAALRRGRQRALPLRLLRTLGADRGIERRKELGSEEFFAHYAANNVPVLLPDFAEGWPALERWELSYFAERFGEVEIGITDQREDDPDYDRNAAQHAKSVPLREFVRRIEDAGESNDFYAVAHNRNMARPELAPLLDDIDCSKGFLDPKRLASSSALWLGPAGTVTPFHHDTSDILFLQVKGRKRFALASPAEEALWNDAFQMYAQVDPEDDWSEVDGLRDVKLHWVELGPGDALFIPVGWWHHVRALTPSVSLAMNGLQGRGNNYDWYRPGAVE